jgi:hypothetical protein
MLSSYIMTEETLYIPLHFHSFFSLLQGLLSPEEICRIARLKGYDSVGITDTNNLYGLIRFIKAAESEGIKPLQAQSFQSRAGSSSPRTSWTIPDLNGCAEFSATSLSRKAPTLTRRNRNRTTMRQTSGKTDGKASLSFHREARL